MAGFPHLIAALEVIPDPRRGQGQRYPFQPLLLFVVLAMLSGALGYQSIATYLEERWQTLNALFGLQLKRAPALNTFRTLIQRLNPACLEDALRRHAQALHGAAAPADRLSTIAIDGKTLRGSHDKAHGQKPAQMLTAFATTSALVLAQIDIEDKSNEIPAAQEMIRSLNIKGVTFTADAIHCQKNIRGCSADGERPDRASQKQSTGFTRSV